MRDDQIVYMANRFLCWPLPIEDMRPDNGLSAERPNYGPGVAWRPVGTNLLDYAQAMAMVRFMVAGMDDPVGLPPPPLPLLDLGNAVAEEYGAVRDDRPDEAREDTLGRSDRAEEEAEGFGPVDGTGEEVDPALRA